MSDEARRIELIEEIMRLMMIAAPYSEIPGAARKPYMTESQYDQWRATTKYRELCAVRRRQRSNPKSQ